MLLRVDIVLLVGVLCWALPATIEAAVPPDQTKPPSPYGDYDFTLTTLDAKTLRLADSHGKVILVNFWETWCPPCVAETPSLVQLYSKYKDDGLVVIGVTENSEEVKVRQFIERFNIPYAIGRDLTSELSRRYQIFSIPTSFLFAPDGKLVRRIEGGYGEQTEAVLGREIQALLRPPVMPPEMPPRETASVEKGDEKLMQTVEEGQGKQEKTEIRPPAQVLHGSPVTPRATSRLETIALEVSQPARTMVYGWWNLLVPLLASAGLLVLARVRLSHAPPEIIDATPTVLGAFHQSVPYARLLCQSPSALLPPEIALVHDDLLLGSGAECDVILRHPSIARQHARLQWRKQGYVLRDLQSPNGTYVNGRPIVENLLKDGWHVRLGEVEFVFYGPNPHA